MKQVYFGVLTCPQCAQKVSMDPGDIIRDGEGEFSYICKRCKATNSFAADFQFIAPVGKNLSLLEAYRIGQVKTTPSLFSKVVRFFRD